MRRMIACLCVALLASVCRGDRAAVESVLARMSKAAAGADVAGYLACVSQADALFYKEQCNWAKDLQRRPPASVTFSIVAPPDGKREEFGSDRARFELLTSWSLPPKNENDKPRVREVSFPVVFERAKTGEWLYAGEDWIVVTTPLDPEKPVADDADEKPDPASERPRDVRFQGKVSEHVTTPTSAPGSRAPDATPARDQSRAARIKCFAGYEKVARRIAAVLPEVRDHVGEGFGGRIDRVQEVKVYPTMKHLQQSIYLSYTDGLAGWNEPGESIKLLVRPSASARSLRTLLAHEYGHVATFELGPKANEMPWWVLEGVAELAAERFAGRAEAPGADAERSVVRWDRAGTLSKWDDLADFHAIQDSSRHDLQAKVYKQGQHLLMHISDAFGRDGRNAWLRAMSGGKTLDQATTEALGLSFAELDGRWRAAVKELAAKRAPEPDGEKPAPEPAPTKAAP